MVKHIRNTFNAGELSPSLDGRTDLAKYHNGCSTVSNGIVMQDGGIVKRPGTEYIATAKGACRLFPFVYSASDSMIIEAGANYMRFYKSGNVETITKASVTDEWAVSTSYVLNDIVKSGTRYFYCVEAHTSSSSAGLSGTHTGDDNAAILTDSGAAFTVGALIGLTVTNSTDGSSGTITDNTETTVTATLSGGTENDWDVDDAYEINSIPTTDSDKWTELTASGENLIYEIYTPYSATEVFDIHTTQSADVLYMAHEDYAPRKLSRVADNSWTIETITFDHPPFLTENTNSSYLLQFTETGDTVRDGYYYLAGATGTLTATGGHTPFLSQHVGSYWLLKHTRQDNVSEIAETGTSSAIRIKGDFTLDCSGFASSAVVDLQRKEGNGDYQSYRKFSSATVYSDTEEADDVYYRVVSTADATVKLVAKDQVNKGIVRVTGHTSSTVVDVEVVTPVYDNNSGTSPTTAMWAEGAWSDYRGYPKAVTFYEDRLCWAGTTNNPQTIWMSKTSDYEDHGTGVVDSDAVNLTINDNDASEIQWIAPRKFLMAGTSTKEYAVGASNTSDPITPSDFKIDPQSSYGSDNIQPAFLNEGLFYAQRNGKRMRVMQYQYNIDGFESGDVTKLASHMFGADAPVQLAVQKVPDSIVWVVRDDGTLCSFVYEPVEMVMAWSRHVTGSASDYPADLFKSVAVIPGTDEDELWCMVQRVINSTTVYYIERFTDMLYNQIDEPVMLDSAVVLSSSSGKTEIVLVSDTIRYGSGTYGSSLYGGTT